MTIAIERGLVDVSVRSPNKALKRFALSITVLNILGHLWLGFEQSWITPFVALAAAYGTELAAETMQASANRRTCHYLGTPGTFISFLLSAHVTGLAVGMLLFAAEQLWVIAFGASLAIASKWLFRVWVPVKDGFENRHFLNPSNFGITIVLLLFPTVGIAPPYMFAENTSGSLDWLLPLAVISTGSLLNVKLTKRITLIGAWLLGFVAQAVLRSLLNGTPLAIGLLPMTGFAFILFTFYMITDPKTTPDGPPGQVMFAASVAAVYGLLMQFHVVFGLFFALTIVSAGRGLFLFLRHNPPTDMPAKSFQEPLGREAWGKERVDQKMDLLFEVSGTPKE
jgi:Na+-translocating ferredoxin:NAD+ oxidoreductase RnfD subunit